MPPLEQLGTIVRHARMARDLTQDRAAKNAGVSRKQWALLEKGENVSVVFLRKVAESLDLKVLPLDGGVTITLGGAEFDLAGLLRIADGLTLVAERLRLFGVDAMMPPSERLSGHAALIDEFATAHPTVTAADAAKLDEALRRTMSGRAPSLPEPKRVPARKESRRRAR